jgi:hypothetical protein
MKNTYRIILYIFIFLLLAGGVVLFIMRNSLVGFLEDSNNLVLTVPEGKVNADRDTLNVEILKSPRFAALAKNVVNFDFDNICWRPDAKVEPAAPDSETATGTPEEAASVNCAKGNNLPFIINKK